MPPGVLAEYGAWMLEMRMLRAETPADGINAAGKYWTSASPGSFHIRPYPTPCTRNGPDVASWHNSDMPPWSLYVRCWGQSRKHLVGVSIALFGRVELWRGGFR
jgi:hypothetical protein